MTRPDVGAQAFIFDKMLKTANVGHLEISYIEMHGTGTQAGDATEMNSVLQVFAKTPRGPENPLYLGSAKANVGHAESSSGVTSMIKVLLMMEKNEIPPHVGIKTKINHNFPKDLKARNVNIALEPTPWHRPTSGKRTVFMNNFSAAGGNTALLMEDAPVPMIGKERDPRSSHVVAISAKSITSLERNIESMVKHIDHTPDLSLPALSYTTTARRVHHNFRAIVTGQDLPSVQQALRDLTPCSSLKPVPANKIPNVIFAFTGQGAAYQGMARELFQNVKSFQADIRRFDSIARSQGFLGFIDLVDDSAADFNDLSPVATQVGTTCVQMALARLWISWGVTPSAVIGHSLGEYAALHVAGVLSASDVIYLVGTRARLLEQRCTAGTHVMLAVKLPRSDVIPHLVGSSCEVACVNSPTDTVISGAKAEIDVLSNLFTTLNIKCVKLEIPFAFHSAQVEPILEDFELAAQGAKFEKPTIPFISSLLEDVVSDSGPVNTSYLRQACRKTVNFLGGIEAARLTGLAGDKTLWVEIGAHPVCSGMLKSILGSQTAALASLRRGGDTWKVIAESTASLHRAGIAINWDEYHRDFESCHEVVRLPAYNWDSKNHWIQYENNFCLTKGDATALPPPVPKGPSLSTASVHRLVDQSIGTDSSSVVIESDLANPYLVRMVNGHKVNGACLVTSSLWADIALTLSDYLLKASNKETEGVGLEVSNMVVEKPLVAHGKGTQLFRASASADWKTNKVIIEIYSVTTEGKKTTKHAQCVVNFAKQDDWLRDFKRNAYLIESRLQALQQGVHDGQSHNVKHGLAYKLFSALVDYGPSFQGMREIVLDSAQLEATAKVEFQTTKEDGEFYLSPYWNDSLGSLAGFVMNANDGIDSLKTVFINHGWEAMRCATKFSRDKVYRTYVRMQNEGGTMFSGDVYIFDEDIVVALFQGIKVSRARSDSGHRC